ncbi:hypothetical protein M407DRAFT_23874 [Tulasnella calospora MUT 4182]|uniref:Uncharacterized protein n=1 Tax=Tulasnella calospora MUT 4182 TaxID=1051891 RepID=A0A0C3Q9Q8_9AGAM|nr:hypothetical protein M407DRAFT_23874 [Tulasnella calospora MUT 4182]
MEEKDLDFVLQRLNEVEEDMGIIFLLAHHSPSFWTVMERMAPLLERRLAPESSSHHDAPSPGQAVHSGQSQDLVEPSPLSTKNTGRVPHPSSLSLEATVDGNSSDESDDDATSDVETTRHARSTKKSEPPEDLHEVISKSWSPVTRMARHWMKSITQWHHGFEDLERGPKKLGILSKNLAIDVSVAPISPFPSQQTSLIDTIKSTSPESNIETAVLILRENAAALCRNGATEALLQKLADSNLPDEKLSEIWGSGFRGGIHCEAQLAHNILQRSPSGHKCLIGISKRCCFCCAAMLKALKINDGDIVGHGKVYSWSPPCEATHETKQIVLEKLKGKFQSYLETQIDRRHLRTPDSGSGTDSEDDRPLSLTGLAQRFANRMAQQGEAE